VVRVVKLFEAEIIVLVTLPVKMKGFALLRARELAGYDTA